MISTYNIKQDDLFFRMVVDAYINNPRFLTRTWLVSEVEECLKNINRHFLLITGEPGIGKSGLIAHLAHYHPNWMVYFIRRDQRTPLGDVDAKSFLLHIGYQLAAIYPKIFEPEAVKVVVEQRIGTVHKSGEVIAIEVEKMLASPFYQTVFQVRQQIERNKGKVTGLRIGELVIDPRLLSLDNLQNMALFDPAEVMLAKYPNEKIVILVDALDELRYHNSEHTLLDWLTNCPQLPSNVHIVLTSRPPDDALVTFCEKQEPYLQKFMIGSDDARTQIDLQTYVKQIVDEEDVASILRETAQGIKGFTTNAVAKADGNIGYLDALARGIDNILYVKDIKTLRKLLTLHELPDHIEELYSFFLRQIKATVDKQRVIIKDPNNAKIYDNPVWLTIYKPILSILAVALEPLTLSQISTLGGIEVGWDNFIEAMSKLNQFLEVVDNRYRLYHETISEFLTSNRLRDSLKGAAFYVDPVGARSNIVTYYRGKAQAWNEVDWGQVDDYGLRNISTHLYELRETRSYKYEIYGLICKPFMEIKNNRFFSHQSFVRDIRLSLKVAGAEQPPNFVQEVRFCLLLSTLSSRYSQISPELLGVLAQAGEDERALSWAKFIIDKRKQCKAYLLIAEALLDTKKKEQAKNVLDKAVYVAKGMLEDDPLKQERSERQIRSWLRGLDENVFDIMESARPELKKEWSRTDALSDIGKALVLAGEPNRAIELMTIIERSERGKALKSIAEALAQEDQLDLAMKTANAIDDDWLKNCAKTEIASAMFKFGKLKAALEIAESLKSHDQVYVLTEIAESLIEEGKADMALTLPEKIKDKDEFFEKEMIVRLVRALAIKGQFNRALDLTETIKSKYSEHAKADVVCSLSHAGETDLAKNIIEHIQLPDNSIFSLCELAKAYAQAGRLQKAKMMTKRAHSIINNIKHEGNRPAALCSVAEAFVCSGDTVSAEAIAYRALKAAQNIPIWHMRVVHWEHIANKLINVVEFEKLVGMVMELDEDHDKVFLCCRLTEELSKVGMQEKAALTAKKAFDIARNPEQIQQSVKVWTSVVDSDEILAAIEGIEDLQDKTSALTALAQALVRSKEYIHASKVADRAIEVSTKINSDNSIDDLLSSISASLAQMKKFDWAMAVLESIKDVKTKASTIKKNAETYTLLGDFDQALKLAKKIDSGRDRIEILSTISVKMYENGQKKRATTLAEKCLHLSEEMGREWPLTYAYALESVVKALAKTKHTKLTDVVKQASALTSELLETDRQQLLEGIARTLAKESQTVIALEIADTMEDGYHKSEILKYVAKVHTNKGNIDQAIAIAKKLDDGLLPEINVDHIGKKTEALLYIAQKLIQKGCQEKAEELIGYVINTRKFPLVCISDYVDIIKMLWQMGYYDKILVYIDTISDKKKRSLILSIIAKEISLIGKKERIPEIARQVLEIIPKKVYDYVEYDSPYSVANEWMIKHLSKVANNLTIAGELDLALKITDIIPEDKARQVARQDIAQELADAKFFEDSLTKEELAFSSWRKALYFGKDLGRKQVLEALESGVLLIASIDNALTLYDIYKCLLEIESWWDH